MRTFGALDFGLFADAAHPFIGARRCVSGLPCLAALEPPRIDILAATEERTEQRDLLLGRGGLINATHVRIHRMQRGEIGAAMIASSPPRAINKPSHGVRQPPPG